MARYYIRKLPKKEIKKLFGEFLKWLNAALTAERQKRK